MPAREIRDDAEYRRWVETHPSAFVLNTHANASVGRAVLHKAVCPHIRSHLTGRLAGGTSRKFVAGSREELREEARRLDRPAGSEWISCGTCGS